MLSHSLPSLLTFLALVCWQFPFFQGALALLCNALQWQLPKTLRFLQETEWLSTTHSWERTASLGRISPLSAVLPQQFKCTKRAPCSSLDSFYLFSISYSEALQLKCQFHPVNHWLTVMGWKELRYFYPSLSFAFFFLINSLSDKSDQLNWFCVPIFKYLFEKYLINI